MVLIENMNKIKYKNALLTAAHVAVVTIVAAWLSNTILRSFTSMLAFKSSVETKDFQLSDLYSRMAASDEVRESENVVLVHTENMEPERMAEVLNIVNSSHPKAIGVDIVFRNVRQGDSLLVPIVNDSVMVMAAVTGRAEAYFASDTSRFHSGDVRFVSESPISVIRRYRPVYMVDDYPCVSFAAALVEASGAKVFSSKDTVQSLIYYPGMDFLTISFETIERRPGRCQDLMRNKIVLIGDTSNLQDAHLTPMGEMSGLRIHAYIVENMLGFHPVRESSTLFNWLMAAVACSLLIILNTVLVRRKMIMAKLLFRIAQLSLLILAFVIGGELFANQGFYIDVSPLMGMVAMSLLVDDVWTSLSALAVKVIKKRKKMIK